MLTEDAVVDAVRDHLVDRGWTIVGRKTVVQRGLDLVAERRGERVIIEAKGEGSSKQGTARYGQSFNTNQVFDHVAKAVLKALRVVASGSARAAIALPDNAHHRNEIAQVREALDLVDVGVFWVNEQGAVSLEAQWAV